MRLKRPGLQPFWMLLLFTMFSLYSFAQSHAANNIALTDTTPPKFAISVSREIISCPNAKMIPIMVKIDVSDDQDIAPKIMLVSIVSDRRDISDDIDGVAFGTDDREFSLRAVADANKKEGRIYTITYSATDKAGNTSQASATVSVPQYSMKPEKLPPVTDAYVKALAQLEHAINRASIEDLYYKANAVVEELNKTDKATDSSFAIRWLAGEEGIPDLLERIGGIDISDSCPDLEPGADIDIQFFLDLANRKGLDQDMVFFRILNEQYPFGFGCYLCHSSNYEGNGGGTIWGELIMANDYSKWLDFRKKYPASYKEQVGEHSGCIEELFSGVCVCALGSEKQDVIKECNAMLKLDLDPYFRVQVENCLEGIKNGSTKLNPGCCHYGYH